MHLLHQQIEIYRESHHLTKATAADIHSNTSNINTPQKTETQLTALELKHIRQSKKTMEVDLGLFAKALSRFNESLKLENNDYKVHFLSLSLIINYSLFIYYLFQ